ncbi:MAG: glycosyltransferase family 39 protein [Planctomycetota bacterium]
MTTTVEIPAPDAKPITRRWGRLFLYVFLASLVVRVFWVANAYVSPIGDHYGYNRSALEWLETGEYRVRGHLRAYKPPGYPALLAVIYKYLGHDWRMMDVKQAAFWNTSGMLLWYDWKVVGFVQSLMGAVASGLLALLGRRIVSNRVGLIAGLLHAFWPTTIAFVPVLANDNLTVLLLITGILCLVGLRDGRGALRIAMACGAGLCLGLMMLVRPSSIFFMPAWLALATLDPVRRRWRPRALLLCALSIGTVVGPWLYYTYSVGLGVGVFSTQGGYALWWGNNWRTIDGGNPAPPRFPGDRELSEREQHEFFMGKATDWIRNNPERYLALCRTRLVRMFGKQQDAWAAKYFFPTAENDRLLRAVYWPAFATPEDNQRGKQLERRNRKLHLHFRIVMAPLMAIGVLFALLRPRRYAYVLLPLACYAAGHALTVFAGRYRVTSDPLIFICLAGFLSSLLFNSGTGGFWRGRWPKLALVVLAITGSIVVHVTKADRGWYRLPTPPAPQPVFDAALGNHLELDILDLERVRPIAAKICDVRLESTPAGLRCAVRGTPDESGYQYGGVALPAGGMTALRMEVTWLNPENIDAIFVYGRDAQKQTCQEWAWRPRPHEANAVPRERSTHVLLVGQSSRHFRSIASDPIARVTQLRIIVRVKPNTESGFVLHDLDIATASRPGFDVLLRNLAQADLSDLEQIMSRSAKACNVQLSASSAGLRCELQGTAAQYQYQFGGIHLPADGMVVLHMGITWFNPENIEAIFVEGHEEQGAVCQRWQWRVRDSTPGVLRTPHATYVLIPGQQSGDFHPLVNNPEARVARMHITVRIRPNTHSGFILHSLAFAALPSGLSADNWLTLQLPPPDRVWPIRIRVEHLDITPAGDGLRCDVLAETDESSGHHGGFSFPAQDFDALRLQLAFHNVKDITAVYVDCYGDDGQRVLRWIWDFRKSGRPTPGTQTYTLVPGECTGPFEPTTEATEANVSRIGVRILVKPGSQASFTLHELAIPKPSPERQHAPPKAEPRAPASGSSGGSQDPSTAPTANPITSPWRPWRSWRHGGNPPHNGYNSAMTRRRRHPVLKWIATITAVIMLAFTMTTFWIEFVTQNAQGGAAVVSVGRVDVIWFTNCWRGGGWCIGTRPAPGGVDPSASGVVLPLWTSLGTTHFLCLPLWPFVALPALLAIWLWRRDRRRFPANHCQCCGYNLTGNQSGVCPECGEVA